jgi:hypothetical protein
VSPNVVCRLFGPSRDEVWRQLSVEMGATFVEGTWRRGARVQARHGEWTVTLDTYTVSTGKSHLVYTRMRAPFVNTGGFRFRVYRKSIFTGLGKLFGMQDVLVGDEAFDADFVVQAENEERVRILLANRRLRDLLDQQKAIQFAVKDDEGWFGAEFPEGVDELHFAVVGVIRDAARLRLLFDLFAETLDELCRMGEASRDAPGVAL